MDKLEEVKKILEIYGKEMIEIVETPDIIIPMVVARSCRARDKTAKEICQLFEPKPNEETLGTQGHNPYNKTEVKVETIKKE